MRIGLVVYGSLDVMSGGNLYDATLVAFLEEAGHYVETISLPHRPYGLGLLQNVTCRGRLAVASRRCDLLVEDELVHPSLLRANASVSRKCPIVSIVHHLRSSEERAPWQNRIYARIEKAYLESVEAFVFNSETTRETVESLLRKKTRHIVATPGGDRLGGALTAEQVGARAREKGPLRLLFVGNLIERKGLHVLVESLSELGDRPWHLDVVGGADMDDGYASAVRKSVNDRGLAERVSFHGILHGDALRERYARSHVLVVPSTYEGFGIVYLEAMSFGLPVIASAAGATDEIVRHEHSGFLVQPGDPFSLRLRLQSLLEEEGRKQLISMSLAALDGFRDHPTWRQSMTAIEAFLRQCVEEGRASREP